MKIRKIIFLIATVGIVLYFYVNFFHDTKVIAIHGTEETVEVLIINAPLSDSEKIKWWDSNSDQIINKSQEYNVSLWRFNGKYQKLQPKNSGLFPDHDIDYLLCFDDIKSDKNCIDKSNWIMDITRSKDGYTYYRLDGESYYRKPSGELIKGARFVTTIK